jgi:hypothetical protein
VFCAGARHGFRKELLLKRKYISRGLFTANFERCIHREILRVQRDIPAAGYDTVASATCRHPHEELITTGRNGILEYRVEALSCCHALLWGGTGRS